MKQKKYLFIFIIILLTGLSFPLQVIFNNSLIFLLPMFITFFLIKYRDIIKIFNSNLNKIDIFIFIIIIYLIFHSIIQFIFTPLSISIIIPIIIFIYSFLMYLYFSIIASDKEIQYFFKGILLMGYISAAFFLYDSFYKFILFQPSTFSLKAELYQISRVQQDDITSRAIVDYRSAGFFDKAPVSAAFVAFAIFNSILNIKFKNELKHYLILSLLVITFFLALNFTSIIAFFISVLAIHFRLQNIIFKKNVLYYIFRLLCIGFFIILTLWLLILVILPENQINIITDYKDFIFTLNNPESSALSSLIDVINQNFNTLPNILSIFLGDGYPGGYYNTIKKGGDFGFIDNIIGLSIFLYLILLIIIFSLLQRVSNINKITFIKFKIPYDLFYINYALYIILFIILMDIHYSIIFFKSIMPLFFISLSILVRKLKTNQFFL